MNRPILFTSALAVAIVCAACKDKQQIQVYRVSKEAPQNSAPDNSGMAAMPGSQPSMQGAIPPPMNAGSGEAITDTPPSGWEPQPPSQMRLASYLVKGENGAVADVSLIVLGGAAGGVLENVNRWASQLGQPALTEDQLKEKATHVSSGLGDVTVVDLEGLPAGGDATKDGRILAGIASADNRTVFFKMRGNAALVAAQKEEFSKWIGSVRLGEAGAKPGLTAEHPSISTPMTPPAEGANPNLPADHPPLSTPMTQPAPAAESAKPQLKWEVPANWKPVQASSMRYASFAVSDAAGGTADLAVSSFPGDTGGDLANVNRWRQQSGLQPVAEAELNSLIVSVKAKDAEIRTVDLAGSSSRILAGWTMQDGSTWFFKLSGPDALVAGEKAAFVKFLESVQFKP